MNSDQSPWQPLYSVDRDGITELDVTGIIAVTGENDFSSKSGGKLFIERGNVDNQLWTRSLLKPFQLVSHLKILQDFYPALKPEHYALMSSSHNGEEQHLKLLQEIIEIGGVSPDSLLCPPSWPGDIQTREKFKNEGKHQRSLFHNCSGKHFSYLMSLKAQGKPLGDYINFDNIEHIRLEQLLARMLKRPDDAFIKTTDGCQMPNYAMSVREMAELYCSLAYCAGAEAVMRDDDAAALAIVGNLMHCYPSILGGSNRLDSKIAQGGLTAGSTARLIAKDGADGLLAIGVMPTNEFKNGLGIVIKLSSGYDIRHMEVLATRVLDILGIRQPITDATSPSIGRTDHIKTNFTFGVSEPSSFSGNLA